MKTKLFIFLIATTFLLSNCATLFGPKSHSISANSNPIGAEVIVDGVSMGVTPVKLELDPQKSYTIEYRKNGYRPITKVVKGKVGTKWIILDVLGGFIPAVVDAVTGKWYEFEDEIINTNLEKN